MVATAGYLHKLRQLPSVVGGNIYAGAWFDQVGSSGGFTSMFDQQRYRAALSLGFVMDTKAGPFSIVGSHVCRRTPQKLEVCTGDCCERSGLVSVKQLHILDCLVF